MNNIVKKTGNTRDFPEFMYDKINIIQYNAFYKWEDEHHIYSGALKTTRWALRKLRDKNARGYEFAANYLVKKAAQLSELAENMYAIKMKGIMVILPLDSGETIFAIQQEIRSKLLEADVAMNARPSVAHIRTYHKSGYTTLLPAK